jgi:regulator of replication initiation timing
MSHDPAPLALASQRKSQDAIARARRALSAMHDAGAPITFQGVAQQAGVSRQWLYKNAQLRAEIEKLRGRQMGTRRVPVAQRASDASLRQRNQTLSQENKRLRGENTELKDELAAVLGERRAAGPPTRGRRHTA